MRKFLAAIGIGLAAAAGPALAAGDEHRSTPGGRSGNHMSEHGDDNANAQFRPDAARGEDRAGARMHEEGTTHRRSDAADTVPHGKAESGARARGAAPR